MSAESAIQRTLAGDPTLTGARMNRAFSAGDLVLLEFLGVAPGYS